MQHFPSRRQYARTVDAQALRRTQQTEFDGVPVQACEAFDCIKAHRFQSADPVGLHVIREAWIEQQGHVSEEIVEHVGLDDLVLLC